jgi:pimeloyl-ACP methyl ester carboxylesterase
LSQKSTWKWIAITTGVIFISLAGLYLVFNPEKQVLNQASRGEAPGEFILLSGGETHYRLIGKEDAEMIVLVHGFSVPSYVWDPTLTALGESGFQVLVYDLYGRGYSERVHGNYDIDLFTTQLLDLLDALEVNDPVVLGGLSMGGPIVSRFTHMNPNRVSGVILIAPEVTQPSTKDIFPLNLPLIGEYLMGAVMEPFLLPKMQTADFVQPDLFQDWETLYRIQLQYKGTGRALLSTIRNLPIHNPLEDYRELDAVGIPVLLIWGEEDQTIGWDQIETFSQEVGRARIEIIPAAGHLAHYERPEVINPFILEFLRELHEKSD